MIIYVKAVLPITYEFTAKAHRGAIASFGSMEVAEQSTAVARRQASHQQDELTAEVLDTAWHVEFL